MNRLKWFKIEEFASPDKEGSENMMEHQFLERLDLARDIYGAPMIINSGFRTIEHNKKVGGVKNSSHLLGLAADIHCSDSSKRFLMLEAFLDAGFTRIGIGSNFIHVDCDEEKAQLIIWTY